MNQKAWVINRLNEGRVSRNEALKVGITRLGAIVNLLNKEGWTIDGRWERTPYKNDYVYEKHSRSFKTADEANNFLRTQC